jgi:hypothetical protein
MADQLAELGLEHMFIGPEAACGIWVGASKRAIKDWTNRDYGKQWDSLSGLKQAKTFIQVPLLSC